MAKTKRQFWVAVVDDDAGMREATRALLRSAGFRSTAYSTAEIFLRSRRIHSAGCLILDMHLPGMNGLQLYSTLCSRGVTAPSILVTGAHDRDGQLHAAALAAGMVAVLHKPYKSETLLQFVQEAAARHPLSRGAGPHKPKGNS
jgi:FixJ family two-component response regulator